MAALPSSLQTNRPSSSYGAPSINSRSNRPSIQYGAPRSSPQAPSTQYLPSRNQAPSTRYLPSRNQAPSTQYGAPRTSNYQPQSSPRNYQAPSSQYGAPSSFQAPSSQYGTPEFQAPSSFGQPSNQYGAPALGRTTPSQQYGTPEFGGNQYSQDLGAGSSFRGTDRAYLPPSSGRGGYAGDDDANSEPANYSFEYMVKDEQSGNDFGHREARQGDRAEGLYYVLLPDGRKQTVEYEADENGYKPRISYEDTGLVSGGYNRNGQSGYQDYQNQGGPY
ncbi:hypothetical protein evm_015102 [Chilo suppressalis]|nr:hypothetical protein evm_015102 [Chilo suppressalis]